MRHLMIRWLLALLPSAVAAQPVVTVDVDNANPPFMYAAGDGTAAGVYPAVVEAVFREMGQPLQLQARPWRRALSELDAGSAAVAGIYKTTERAQRYDYSEPLLVERLVVYVHRSQAWPVTKMDDHKGRLVGIIAGWSYGDAFDAARRSGAVKVEEVPSDEQNFRKLNARRLDAVIAIDESARPLLARFPDIVQAGVLAENPTYLAINKSAAQRELIDRFNDALARLRRSGQLDRLLQAQFAPP